MSDLFTRYTALKNSGSHTYFAGANTADGFAGAYEDFIGEPELTRLYILKGGSGTGKSSLMKACAERAVQRGAEVTTLLCSSDQSSADAVILRGNGRSVAILDGTAPHTRDPLLPGAVSCIVNAGDHWNASALQKQREEITLRTLEKKAAYERAYRFLGAYRHLTDVLHQLLLPCLDTEKMAAAADRIVSSFSAGEEGAVKTRYTYALSMTGAWHLPTFSERAKTQFRILDGYGSGCLFLQMLSRKLSRHGTVLFSPVPACPDMPAELFCENAEASFSLADERTEAQDGVRYVNMQRFLDRKELAGVRARLRFTDRCRQTLFDGALESLADARRAHFALEEIYKSAMDFESLSREKDRLCDEIGELLGI